MNIIIGMIKVLDGLYITLMDFILSKTNRAQATNQVLFFPFLSLTNPPTKSDWLKIYGERREHV